jgi:hypothetical protein
MQPSNVRNCFFNQAIVQDDQIQMSGESYVMQPVNNAFQTGRNFPSVVSNSGFSIPSNSNMDHSSLLLGGPYGQNFALFSQAAQIQRAIALLQTQHQSIMLSFGSPSNQQLQAPCPPLQNLSTESMVSGAIYSHLPAIQHPMLSFDLLHGTQAQSYRQLDHNSLPAHPACTVQYGGPHQHQQIHNSPIHADHSSTVTENYPLGAAYHGGPSGMPPQPPASRPSPVEPPQPEISPAARQSYACDQAAAVSTFQSALASARAQESDGGSDGGGGGKSGAGGECGVREQGRGGGRPANPAGKAVLDAAVRPARASTPRASKPHARRPHIRIPSVPPLPH